jgi:hypothetical protein
MLPVDTCSLAPDAVRALFLAIEEGRFEMVPTLAKEYACRVKHALYSSAILIAPQHQELAMKPLCDALRLLRVVRAHQSARFQQLAANSTSPYTAVREQHHRRNLSIHA